METLYNPVTASKEIKKQLKARFPSVKFSVRSEFYSGGNSINVSWDLGPTTKQVKAIAAKFQEGNFDGMTDCYNYDPTLVLTQNNEFKRLGGAKYVFCNRNTGSIYKQAVQDALNLRGIKDGNDWSDFWGDNGSRIRVSEVVYSAFCRADLTNAVYKGMKFREETCNGLDCLEVIV